MPKDDLMLELEKYQDQMQWFMMAERSFRDPKETGRRQTCNRELLLIREEINHRKHLGKLALAKLETKNSMMAWIRRTWSWIRRRNNV